MLKNSFNEIDKILSKLKVENFKERKIETLLTKIKNILIASDMPYDYVTLLLEEARNKLSATYQIKFNNMVIINNILKSYIDETFIKLTNNNINIKKFDTTVIGVYGTNGVGKTSFSVKLANFLQKKYNKRAICVSFDMKKKTSQEQLKILCKNNDIEYLDIMDYGFNKGINKINEIVKYKIVDLVIIDNACYCFDNSNDIETLKKSLNKINFDEKIIIADGTYGQSALPLISKYCSAIEPTGFAISKIDSSQNGGSFFTIATISNKPIYYITNGEKINNICELNRRMLQDLLFKNNYIKQTPYPNLENNKKFLFKNTKQFNYNDLLKYLIKLNKNEKFNKIPFIFNNFFYKTQTTTDINLLIKKWISTIYSMTKFERVNFKYLSISRINRIAKGSGVSVDDIMFLQKKIEEINMAFNNVECNDECNDIKD